jgi:hypothetical protein
MNRRTFVRLDGSRRLEIEHVELLPCSSSTQPLIDHPFNYLDIYLIYQERQPNQVTTRSVGKNP